MLFGRITALLSGLYFPLFILYNRPFAQIVYTGINSMAASKAGFGSV
jgi:hypothetical protein